MKQRARSMDLPERVAYWRLEDVLGCKWTTAVLGAIGGGVHRPGELERHIAGISKKILLQRLKKLERFELIERRAFDERLPRVEYRLTTAGRKVYGIIGKLRELENAWPGPCPAIE